MALVDGRRGRTTKMIVVRRYRLEPLAPEGQPNEEHDERRGPALIATVPNRSSWSDPRCRPCSTSWKIDSSSSPKIIAIVGAESDVLRRMGDTGEPRVRNILSA